MTSDKDKEIFVGKQLRQIVKTEIDELAHKLNINFQTAKLVQRFDC